VRRLGYSVHDLLVYGVRPFAGCPVMLAKLLKPPGAETQNLKNLE